MNPLKHKSEEPGLSSKLLRTSHWVPGESQSPLMAWATPELSLASPPLLTSLFSPLQPCWPLNCSLKTPSALRLPDLHACLFPTMGTFFPRQQQGWLPHLLWVFARMTPHQGSFSLNDLHKIAVPTSSSPLLYLTLSSQHDQLIPVVSSSRMSAPWELRPLSLQRPQNPEWYRAHCKCSNISFHFWLCWVFVAVFRLSLVAASVGYFVAA